MYNTCGAPVLDNYAQAKEWHDRTKPIRGQNIRPLGSRRHYHMASITMDGDDVVLNYYGQKAVVWHPNDSLTLYYPRWCTAFEPDKMAHFLPSTLSYKWNKRRFIVHNRADNTELELTGRQPIKLEAVDVMGWNSRIVRKFKFGELPQTYSYVKRRNMTKKIMDAKFGAFLAWVDTVRDFTPKVFSPEHTEAIAELFYAESGVTREQVAVAIQWSANTPWNDEHAERKAAYSADISLFHAYPMGGPNSRGGGFHRAGVNALYKMMLAENQEHWLQALQIIAGHQCPRTWGGMEVGYRIEMPAIVSYLEKVIYIVHTDEVFEKRALQLGEIGSKTYTEYIHSTPFVFFEITDTVSDISV